MKVIIEPFKIKSVEPICMNSKKDRIRIIKEANYNLFLIESTTARMQPRIFTIK